MRIKLPLSSRILTLAALISVVSMTAQVGINTTTPQDGSMLDITSSDKGILVPRVDIADLSTIAPITGGSTESLLVYNTNATTGPGFFYWDSSQWVGLNNSDDWKETGNAGTTPATNFVGTTDNVGLRFRTNNTERFEITNDGRFRATSTGSAASPLFAWSGDTDTGFFRPNTNQFGIVTNGVERLKIPSANQVHAMANGSNSAPFYTWNSDQDSGLYRSAADRINISAGGVEMVEFKEGGSGSEVVFNDGGDDTNFRVESANENDIIFVDANDDRLGLFTDSPAVDLHVAGNTTGVRIDAFSSTNDADNNGVDAAAIYVDANGNLTLEGPLTLNNMPEDNFTTFVPTAANIGSACGSFVSGAIYNTTITLTQDALIEVVYQIGVNITDAAGTPITDGDPRQYGTALFIDTNLVGYTSEAYTSAGSGNITSGTFFLNGNGYAQLSGVPAGTTYNVSVYGFVYGGETVAPPGMCDGDSVNGQFGGNVGTDRFQLILHH